MLTILVLGCEIHTAEYQTKKLKELSQPIIVVDRYQLTSVEMYVVVEDCNKQVVMLSYFLGGYFYNRKMIGDTITQSDINSLNK